MLLSVVSEVRSGWGNRDGLVFMTDRIGSYCDRFIIDIIRRLTLTY